MHTQAVVSKPGIARPHQSLAARLWQYQMERFPLKSYALLIAAFLFGGVGWAASMGADWPNPLRLLSGWITLLGAFFTLRVLDEHKDAVDDARWRPYRPVPRGLVSLQELRSVALVVLTVQAVLNLWLDPGRFVYVLIIWAWLGLMGREFFASRWLRARPLLYLALHDLFMPLLSLYMVRLTGPVDWQALFPGLPWLLVASYLSGFVFDLGRKIRAPEAEEPGVETYSALWGRRRAVGLWLLCLTGASFAAGLAAVSGHPQRLVIALVSLPWLAGVVAGWRFVRNPIHTHAERIPLVTNAWALLLFVALGLAALFGRVL